MRRILVGATIVAAMMVGAYTPDVGADERTLVRAVEKLIIDHKQLAQENQVLKERILALETKVLKLEGQAKETRSSMSSTSPGNDKGLLARLKVFLVGSGSVEKSKELAVGPEAPAKQQPEKNSSLVQQQPGSVVQDRRPDDGAEVKPNVSVVDPLRLLKQEKPKDCSSAGEEELGGPPVKRGVEPPDSGCSG
jgi:hypothetical protein